MNAVLLVFAPLAVAYAVTLVWCVDRWNAPTGYFAHCWLVPPLAAFLAWRRRAVWRARPCAVDRAGWWLLAPALVLHLAGAALMIDSWSAASLALAVPGALWLGCGRARLAGQWPIVWLVLFAIPLPLYAEGRLAFELKEIAVRGGSWLANAVGADVLRFGDRLQPRGMQGSLYVAAACGGLRSLLAMLALGYCLAFFSGPPGALRRGLLLAVAAPLAILANVVRIAVLCVMARVWGVAFAEDTGHTIANVVEWLGLVGALVAIDGLLVRRLATGAVAVAAPAPAAAAVRARGSLRFAGVAAWLCAGPLLLLSLYRPTAAGGERAGALPTAIAGYELQALTPAQAQRFAARLGEWRELLGTDDFVHREYHDASGRKLFVTALFHDTNWKSVHPPRICIEGGGMDIAADEVLPAPWLGPGATVSRIVAHRPADGWTFVTLSVFGTGDWLSGSYVEFVRHHWPLALLRRNQSGFLLRVEAPIYPDETPAAAEARSAEFLAQLLPLARGLLR